MKRHFFTTSFLFILFISVSVISCKVDYNKEVDKFLAENNAVYIGGNWICEKPYFVYHDYQSVYYKEFDSKESKLLLSKNKEYIVKELKPEFTTNGEIVCKEYIYDWETPDFSFLDSLYTKSPFWERGDRCMYIELVRNGDLNDEGYLYSYATPNVLYKVGRYEGELENSDFKGLKAIISNSMWNVPNFHDTFLEYAPDVCYYYDRGCGMKNFIWNVAIDENGKIRTDLAELKNEKIFTGNQFIPVNILGTNAANNYLMQEAEYYKNEYKEMLISEIKENSITLNQLSAAFKNRVKAEDELVGQEFYLACKIEAIERADGFFDLDGYKYKISSSAFEAFDQWISGYDFIGYTNDDDFVALNYPTKVILRGTLYYGDNKLFKFKNCELLLY